jgi:ABC-type branched-subunit amino acid transport system ATPase component
MDGVALKGMPTYARTRRGLGVVPEGVAGLFPTLTVRQNLAAVVPCEGNPRTRAWETMQDHLKDLFGEVLVLGKRCRIT